MVHLPASVEAADIRRALERAASYWPECRGVRLWEAAGCDRAAREAARPIGRSRSWLRAVLTRRSDGNADLVLVARRSKLPKAGLIELAALLAGGAEPRAKTPPASAPESPRLRAWPAIPWGLGDRRDAGAIGTVPLRVAAGAERLLLAATALTLSRYDPGEPTRIGAMDGGALAVVSFAIDERETITDYLERITSVAADQSAPVGVLFGECSARHQYRPCLAPIFPLTFYWEHAPDGTFAGVCWYDRGLVSAPVAAQFAAGVARVAGALATFAGDRPLADIDLMSSEAEREVLRSASSPASGPVQRIDDRFAEIVRRQPDAPAVRDGEGALSYRQLDALAERIATGLRAVGVSPGDRIGVCLDRGVAMVATFLAVLKADCAYVPMDIRQPEARLRTIALDAGVPVVVCSGGFPALDGVRLVAPAQLEAAHARDTPRGARHNGPAYAIYTSGSTGSPKGVLVPHSNVAALIDATQDEFALGEDDVWTLFHSSAFDFSVWEIWGCLLTGGALVVVPFWVSRSPDEFRELLAASNVTILSQTPSAFAPLIEAFRSAAPSCPRLRLVVLGGEPFDARMLAPWFAQRSHSACRVVNMFGITETTVHATLRTMTPADAERGTKNVGRALRGWSLSVRDARGRVLPYGAAGEIFVGGAGVASGYLGRPELTAERFPLDAATGLRVYRSGDIGRLHPDGSLDHLGRRDNQVKLRGHRIELDEIRAVLMDSPEVTQAAVAILDDGDTARARIVAYAVLKAGATPRAVLESCRLKLPDYMVPSALAAVDALPLTINGKVDLARLPPPSVASMLEVKADHADPIVGEVLRLWSCHLETNVGVSDNFFELGGTSLLVVRVLGELKKLDLPKMTVQQFYRNSTAAQFAALLRAMLPK